jgi:hypothetical protein
LIEATALVGDAAWVRAVAKLVLRTVSLLAKNDAAAITAIAAPAERPSQKGRICCVVMLRTSNGLVGY